MTAQGTVSRQKERGLPAVILAEFSRPAEGGTTGFGGNPEERSQPPWHLRINNKMIRRSSGRVLVAMITAWIPAFFDPDGAGLHIQHCCTHNHRFTVPH